MKEKLNYTLVMGYGWSGSSAVVDLIKEIDGFEEAGVEFRVIKDPYGVIDLRSRLAEKWDPLNSDMAIRDFLWLVDRLNGKQSYFSKAGLEYQKYFGDQFLKASYQYIENLIQFGYRGSWWFMDFKMSFGNYFFKRLLRKMKIYDFSQQRKMNFSCLTEQEFDRITQEYMDALFASLIKIDTDHVVIDQALPMHSISLGKNFFRGAKIIVVDRDPRDIYVDLIHGGGLIGRELAISHDTEKYIRWHRALRSSVESKDQLEDVLFINFEDLVLQYDTARSRILQFLGVDPVRSVKEKEYFVPEKSKKNVGLWKDYEYPEEINRIQEALPDFCRAVD